MQTKVFSKPNITQPVFKTYGFNPFARKPIILSDKPTRWRKMADKTKKKNAYITAKHFSITPKTFYKWHSRFDNGKIGLLEEKSRAPVKRRTSTITFTEECCIKKIREKRLHWGKRKIAKIYKDIYKEKISAHKIQVVINKFNLYPNQIEHEKLKKKLKQNKKKNRIQKLEIKEEHWFLFHLDTIVFYYNHLKRYVLTATDHHGKIAYARMYNTKSSKSAKDFLYRLHYLIDTPIANIQTDNGSEFYDQFEKALLDLDIKHWFSRARTPEDNAVAERFNQTIQVEWINDSNFTTNTNVFNKELTEWLIEYNFVRPHQSLDYMNPFEYLEYTLTKQRKLLPMYSARTLS